MTKSLLIAVALIVCQAVFITLKLCSAVMWSWGIVLLPLWIGLFVIVLFLIVTLLLTKDLPSEKTNH